jgi:hypothetical protein
MARVRQAAELQMRLTERVTLERKLAAERARKQALKELEAREQSQRRYRLPDHTSDQVNRGKVSTAA